MDFLQIDHTHAGSSSGFYGSPGKFDFTENSKLDGNNDNGESVLHGLEGGMGKGVDWLASQGVIDVFNGLSEGSDSVMIVPSDLFRSPGGLIPRNADVIIVLSEDWTGDLINITNCYKLRMMKGSHTGSPVTVLRLAGKGTIEEAVLRMGGGISALQGLKISDILDFGSSIPKDVMSPTQMLSENNYRSSSFDATGMSPCSHVTLPPSLPFLPFPSSLTSKDVDAKRTFLSAAPYLGKGKNVPHSALMQNRSRSNTQIESSPVNVKVDVTDNTLNTVTSTSALPSNTVTDKPTPAASAEVQLQLQPQSQPVLNPELEPPILESESTRELAPASESSIKNNVTEIEEKLDVVVAPMPMDVEVLPESGKKDVIQSSVPNSTVTAPLQVVKTEKKCDVVASELKAIPEVLTVAPVPPVERTEESIMKEAAASRWRGAFYRALQEAKDSCTAQAQHSMYNGLVLALAARVTSHSSGPSLSSSAGAPSGLLPSLPLAPVVKRTYAPRKKSDLSADPTGEAVADKPATLSSPVTTKNKDEDDDADGKSSKNKKPERKKDKKKSMLTITREAMGLIPSVTLGGVPASSTIALTIPSISSSSSFSSSSASSSSSTTAVAPTSTTTTTTTTATTITSTSVTATTTATATAIVGAADTLHHSKDDESHTAPDKAHTDDSDGPWTVKSEDSDVEDNCESCWSADRLAESILSLGMYGIQGSRYAPFRGQKPGVNVGKLGLALRMVYTINRDWQLAARNMSEDLIGGTAKLPTTVYPQRALMGLHAGPFNGPGRPPSVHLTPATHTTAPSSSATENANSSGGIGTLNLATESYTGMYSSQTAQNRSTNKLRIKSEFGPGCHRPPTPEAESRLNRKVLCEMDKIRLSRAGVGVTEAEQLFWSLVEPFTETPLDKVKEPPKIRPPGSFGGNVPPPVPIGSNTIQSYSAMSFHESLRELRRKGIAVDPLVQAHPLQNAMRGDLQLVPTWGRKSAITDSHTQFTIRYLFPRANSSKSARKSRAAQNVNPRGEKDKEPVRKRVLDQPMLITNVRNVRTRLEAGINSRPSSLGGTVNPFFTRLPPIRTTLKPRGE